MAENDINVMQETAEGNLQEVSLATSGIAAGLHDATNAQTGVSVNDYVLRVYGPSGHYVDIDAGSITAVRGLYFPNASGTLALDGHTHSSLYDATNQAIGLSIDNYVLSHTAANGAVTFAGTNLTGNRAYQYPDASGTLALTTSPPASHTHPATAISDSTTAGRALLTAADAAAQRTSLGLGTLAIVNDAASDGKQYARKNAAWVEVVSGGEVRADANGNFTYTGLAAAGTSNATAAWEIRRSEFSSAGTYVSTKTATNVKWDDRLTASYS